MRIMKKNYLLTVLCLFIGLYSNAQDDELTIFVDEDRPPLELFIVLAEEAPA